ncbi:insulinase family protein [Paenibacillus tuaregi]|uniref:insulinase family protein n=1 Tax=Paenibacillus tuaregi TaxID=1816681 RepID=UPI00083916C8|nr:insulinase family protein [Paenibacillus tuaregi]
MPNITHFEQNQGLYVVEGPFDGTLLSICIKAGCEAEPEGKNGLAHLVEHICLAYRNHDPILEKYNSEYKQLGFHFSGYTNYGLTVLNISFPSSAECLNCCVHLIKEILQASIVNEDTFQISKKEILAECNILSERWRVQKEIINYITNGQINILPVGDKDQIEQLTEEDVRSFINKFYILTNMAFIIQTSLSLQTVKNAVLGILFNNNEPLPKISAKEIAYLVNQPAEFYYLKSMNNIKKIELFFHKPYTHIDLKVKIVRMLFEIMLTDCIAKYLSYFKSITDIQHITISDRHITNYYYYHVISLYLQKGDCDMGTLMNELIDHLRSYFFTVNDFEEAKRSISTLSMQSSDLSMEHIFDNLSANFFYDEPMHITADHFEEILNILGDLKSDDVNIYKNLVLSAPCKVVIEN